MKINQYFITNNDCITIDADDFSLNKIDDYSIYSHKKLKVNSFKNSDNALVILGDIFNPAKPDESNVDIGNALVKEESLDHILRAIDKLTGRFVIFIKTDSICYMVSDFYCQRQVYYWFDDDLFYASSSPKLILDTLNLDLIIDEEKSKLRTSNYFLKIHEHWLLGETDWDDRLIKLLPNHFLNINKKLTQRIPIFATRVSNKSQLEKEFLSILKNSIDAYSKRYDLMQGLTAGHDTRLLMSLSITLKNAFKYFTFSRDEAYVNRDVAIAKQLASKFSLDHHVIETERLSAKFKSEYETEFLVPRLLDKTKNIQWFKNSKFKNTAVVSGNGGTRSVYNDDNFKNSTAICKEIEFDPNALNLKLIDSWLDTAKTYANDNEISIGYLFYLEMRMGKWGNKMVYEMDMTNIEEFIPYNNRHLLFSILLNYNEEEHKTITLNLLEQSFEGITKIPINPKTWKDTLKSIIFYDYYKKWIQKIK